jgi:uncharacterized protein (TIGR03032 family)
MAQESFALTTSRGFESWLHRSGGAIAFTTYQAGKLCLLGLKPDGRLGVFERTFTRCMGVAVSGDSRTLLLATQYQLFRFDNALPPGSLQDHHDAVYVPRLSWITGDLDIHDVGFGGDGTPPYLSTRGSPASPPPRVAGASSRCGGLLSCRSWRLRTAAISMAWPWTKAGRAM